jgi:hypothetical protein
MNQSIKTTMSLATAISAIVLAGSLQAAVTFNVTDIGPGNAVAAPSTTLGGAAIISDADTSLPTVNYTLTTVDLTSIGGSATEQIEFSVVFSTTSGGIGVILANGHVYNTAGIVPNQVEAGEDLTATIALTSTTFSGGLANLSAGFTSTSIGGASGDPNLESWNIVHDSGTQAGSFTLGTEQTLPSSSFWTLQDVDTTGGNAGVNMRGYTVTITAVPEPSSAALLGLGGVALIFRRRK